MIGILFKLGVRRALPCAVLMIAAVHATAADQIFVVNGNNIGKYTRSGATINSALVTGLVQPEGIAVDGRGFLYTLTGDGRLGKYTTSGHVIDVALVSGLCNPWAMALDGKGHIFIANYCGGVGEYTTEGEVINPTLIPVSQYLTGIALDDDGNLFLSVYGTPPDWRGSIGLYKTSGATVNPALITGIQENWGLALDGNHLFVVMQPFGIAEYTTSGTLINPAFVANLSAPTALAYDDHGHLFVGNDFNGTVGEYTTAGATVNAALIAGLIHPRGVAVGVAPKLDVWSEQDRTNLLGSSTTFSGVCKGTRPLACQWYLNGTNMIDGATEPVLELTNIEPAQVGFYSLIATNAFGAVTSPPVKLRIASPPEFQKPPPSQTAEAGSSVRLSAAVGGDSPLSYEWFFQGVSVSGPGTNSALNLTNVQASQAGAYTVIVTNVAGGITSNPAMLAVIPAVERKPVPALLLTGEKDQWLNIQYTEITFPFQNWLLLDSLQLSDSPQYFFDLAAPVSDQRFYRTSHTNSPAPPPAMDLRIVPAITLTGGYGDMLRVDYINRFGPTDAWVNLTSLELTSTSQLYFDVSAPGQPPRLYRLTPVP